MSKKRFVVIACILALSACDSVKEKDAVACFNPDLYQANNLQISAAINEAGDVIRLNYESSQSAEDEVGKIAKVVTRQFPFQNNKKSDQSDSKETALVEIDPESKKFIYKSSNTHYKTGLQVDMIAKPNLYARFDYNTGDNSTLESRLSVLGDEYDKDYSKLKKQTHFTGMEKISTPLGTFETCHFRYKSNMLSFTDNQPTMKYTTVEDMYLEKGTGLPIKSTLKTKNEPIGKSKQMLHSSFQGESVANFILLKAKLGNKQLIVPSKWLKKHHLDRVITAD